MYYIWEYNTDMEYKFSSDILREAMLSKRLVKEKKDIATAAAEIGVSKATVSRLENSMPPDMSTFGKVCGWLGMSPADFFIKEA